MNVEQISKICHQANKAFCENIGDNSQVDWDDAPLWQQAAAEQGVKFHLENETTASDSHNAWMKEKIDTGWVYGEVKDPEARTHPCIVPYEELPLEQQQKDYLFKAIVDIFK